MHYWAFKLFKIWEWVCLLQSYEYMNNLTSLPEEYRAVHMLWYLWLFRAVQGPSIFEQLQLFRNSEPTRGEKLAGISFFPVPLKKAILGKIEIYDMVLFFFFKHSKSEAILIAVEHKNVLWNTWLAHKMIEFGILNVKVWFMKTTIIHLLIELTFRRISVCNRQSGNTESLRNRAPQSTHKKRTFLSVSS